VNAPTEKILRKKLLLLSLKLQLIIKMMIAVLKKVMKNTKSKIEEPSEDKVCNFKLFTMLMTSVLRMKFIPTIRPEAKICK